MDTDDPFQGPDQTTLRVAGTDVTITLADARQMRTAVLDYVRQSDIGDKDELVKLTQATPAWIDPDGRVRAGGWVLEARGAQLMLACRISQNDERAVGYAAFVTRGPDGWKVLRVVPEKIRFRP